MPLYEPSRFSGYRYGFSWRLRRSFTYECNFWDPFLSWPIPVPISLTAKIVASRLKWCGCILTWRSALLHSEKYWLEMIQSPQNYFLRTPPSDGLTQRTSRTLLANVRAMMRNAGFGAIHGAKRLHMPRIWWAAQTWRFWIWKLSRRCFSASLWTMEIFSCTDMRRLLSGRRLKKHRTLTIA